MAEKTTCETFTTPPGHALEGVEKPGEWEEWSHFRRAKWVVAEGHAPDVIDAVGLMVEAGEWPEECVWEPRDPGAHRGRVRHRPRDHAERVEYWWEKY